jgi:hypothetical protein
MENAYGIILWIPSHRGEEGERTKKARRRRWRREGEGPTAGYTASIT